MASNAAYDLFVLIDGDAPEDRRTQILDAIRKQISSGSGELKTDVDWGVRRLAFEIAHRGDAYYHLFQLEADPELLNQLEHSLAIDDAVLRHRIIRLPKGVPEKPPPSPGPSAPRATQPVEEGTVPAALAVPEVAEAEASLPDVAAAPESAETPAPSEDPETPGSSATASQ